MPEPEMGAWESKPVVREDVVRETDPSPEEDLPSDGVTRSLQSQYHTIASQQTPSYTPSGVSRKVRAACLTALVSIASFSVDCRR